MSLRAPDWDEDGRDWPNREASRVVSAGGLRWHVQVLGTGPTLLLVHGTGAATHSWRDLAPRLARRFTIVAPDLPGHGFTSSPGDDRMSMPAMAAQWMTTLQPCTARVTPASSRMSPSIMVTCLSTPRGVYFMVLRDRLS